MADEIGLMMLEFNGHAETFYPDPTQQLQIIQSLNNSSDEIVQELQRELKIILPPFVSVEAQIMFYTGSIDWVLVIKILDWMSRIVAVADFIDLTARVATELSPIIRNVLDKIFVRMGIKIVKPIELERVTRYTRPISLFKKPFKIYGSGEISAFSRIFKSRFDPKIEEMLYVSNTNDSDKRGADVLVDASLNPPNSLMTVIAKTDQTISDHEYKDSHPLYSTVEVKRARDGKAFVEIRNIKELQTLVLTNSPNNHEKVNEQYVLDLIPFSLNPRFLNA